MCNRLNIKACQIMVETQSDHQDPLRAAYPGAGVDDLLDTLKQAATMWIASDASRSAGVPTGQCYLLDQAVSGKSCPVQGK